jgi:hypothetical protein
MRPAGPRSLLAKNMNNQATIFLRLRLFHALAFMIGLVGAQTAVGQDVATADVTQNQIQFLGFGNIDYVSSDSDSPGGFTIGQVVGHVSAAVADRLNVFGEISATAHDSNYTVEVERVIARYDFNNDFSLSAGRYHTPIGYWNTAYHHGAWLQTSVGRPEVVRFGSPLVPIHFVGLLFEGDIPASDHNVSYSFGVGNGRHSNIGRAGDAGDINSNRAWTATLKWKPSSINGIDTGISVYSDLVDPAAGVEVEEKLYSLHFALERETPEVIVEFIHADHDATAGPASGGMDAYYAQLAYRLKGRSEIKPYVRFENTDIDDSDPLLSPANPNYKAAIAGVRYDFATSAALKLEYRSDEMGNLGRDHSIRAQLSFVLLRN